MLHIHNIIFDTTAVTAPTEGQVWYDGTAYGFRNGSQTFNVGTWSPTATSLGDWASVTAGTTAAAGAGYYYNFDGASDDEIACNVGLDRNGIAYDGSAVELVINMQKFGASGGTIEWELDYYFAADGADAYTSSDGTVTLTQDVTALGNQTQATITMPSISGNVGDTHLQLTLRVNATGAGQGSYSGDAEVYGVNIQLA